MIVKVMAMIHETGYLNVSSIFYAEVELLRAFFHLTPKQTEEPQVLG